MSFLATDRFWFSKVVFGLELEKQFQQLTFASPKDINEIFLFNQLYKAFTVLNKNFNIDILHGIKHQVRYLSLSPWAPHNRLSQCELCDLMIITFQDTPTFKARLTFLQNKYERVTGKPSTFIANMRQWELLALKPDIYGSRSFNPPKELLSKALLPSIGSLGIFYKQNNSYYNMMYSAANILCPHTIGTAKERKLKYRDYLNKQRKINGYRETTSSSSLSEFGYHLANLTIGTPIEDGQPGFSNFQIRKWLLNMLETRISSTPDKQLNYSIIKELIDKLKEYDKGKEDRTVNSEYKASGGNGPTIIVIKKGMMLR